MPKSKKIFRNTSAKYESATDSKRKGTVEAINTWDGIEHDLEDEFHERREKVLMGGGENDEEEDYEDFSDEEVLAIDDDADEDEDEDEEDQGDEELNDDNAWGHKKSAYYNTDEFEDLDEAREEEAEAIRLQKKKLDAMEDVDFLGDEALMGWDETTSLNMTNEEGRKLLENFNKDLNILSFSHIQTERINNRIKSNYGVAEKIKILNDESPELMDLLHEFDSKLKYIQDELEPIMELSLQHNSSNTPLLDFLKMKNQLLLNYLANISFYLVLKSSMTTQVREHPVIQSLVEIRATLLKIEKVEKAGLAKKIESFVSKLQNSPKLVALNTNGIKLPKATNRIKKLKHKGIPRKVKDVASDQGSDLEEEISAAFVPMIKETEFKSLKKVAQNAKKRKRLMDNDFGDQVALDAMDAADKTAKKKSLRHYTTKIGQSASKRAAKYQGDVDIPYKDRSTKTTKAGVAQPKGSSVDLDGLEWNEADIAMTRDNNDDAEEYYDKMKAANDLKKTVKRIAYERSKAGLLFEDTPDDGEKRGISYQILKNKGLTPHRKKEQRNPRIKNKNRYQKKMSKLKSFKRIVTPLTGTYGGEKTGIKSGLSRSVRFT